MAAEELGGVSSCEPIVAEELGDGGSCEPIAAELGGVASCEPMRFDGEDDVKLADFLLLRSAHMDLKLE